MDVSYSALRGTRVADQDGRRLGRMLDVIVGADGPDGDEVVVTELVVAPSRFALFLNRLHPDWGDPQRMPADILEVSPTVVRVRGRR